MSKLIYIVSTGHSGSTLTDMWLGKIPGVFSTGEIIHLPWQLLRGANPEDQQTYCSCGKDFEQCSFWSAALARLKEKTGHDIYQSPLGYDTSIHASQHYDKKSIFHSIIHIGLLQLHGLIGNTPLWKTISAYYASSIKNNWTLYDSIAEESGSEYVIDSSKNFLRYLFLKSMRPNDVKLVVLIRNVHGVASSSHHGLNEKIIKERANDWERFYSRVGRFLKGLNKEEYYLLNYEKMCSAPEEELKKVASFIGIPEEKVPLDAHIDTKHYHLVAGNPIRHQGKLKIRYDQRWKERLNEEQIAYLDTIQKKVMDIIAP